MLGKYQGLLRKQSLGLNILRTLASYTVQYKEDDDGQILSAELRKNSPESHVNQTVSITFIRGEVRTHSRCSGLRGRDVGTFFCLMAPTWSVERVQKCEEG